MTTTAVAPYYPFPGEEFAPVERAAPRGDSAQQISRMIADMLGNSNRSQAGLTPQEQVQSLTGWVFVAVKRIREAVASTKLHVYQSNRTGDESDEITDPKHPLVKLLRSPNPEFDAYRFWCRTITFYELTGNAIWLKVRQGEYKPNAKKPSPVVELWPIPTQFVSICTDRDDKYGWYEVYNGATTQYMPPWDVVHLMQDNPADQFWGLGTLAAAAAAMKSQDAIKAAQLASFDNEILSSLYFHTKDVLQTPQWQRALSQLKQRYGGVKNAGSPLFLEGGVQVGNLQRAPKEMAFLESSQFTREEILAVFGVPPILAGIDTVNRANSQEQINIFDKYTTWPRCVAIQSQVNKSLANDFEGVEVEFDSPDTSDRKQIAEEDSSRIEAGDLTINEVRERQGLPPLPGCDKPRFMIEAELRQGSQQPPQPGEGTPDGDEITDDTLRVGRPPATRSDLASRRQPIHARALTRKLLMRSIQSDYDTLESETIPPLRKYFAAQAKRIKDRLPQVFGDLDARAFEFQRERIFCVNAKGTMCGRLFPDGTTVAHSVAGGYARIGRYVDVPNCCYADGEWSEVLTRALPDNQAEALDDWELAADRLAAAMLPRLEQAMVLGGTMQVEQIGAATAFNLADERAQEWLRGKQREYWDGTVNATTKQLLSEKLAEVMADAPTLDKLEAAVEAVMSGRIQSSARTIARTETGGAYNGAADIVRSENGIEKKEWIATMDERTRATHFAADDQTVPQDQPFIVGFAQLRYPGDPNGPLREICNCRCTSVAVVD